MNLEKLKELVKTKVPYCIKVWKGAKWLYVVDKEGLQHYHYGNEDNPFSHIPDGCVFFKPIDEITDDDLTPFYENIYGFREFLQSSNQKVIR